MPHTNFAGKANIKTINYSHDIQLQIGAIVCICRDVARILEQDTVVRVEDAAAFRFPVELSAAGRSVRCCASWAWIGDGSVKLGMDW